MSRQSTDKEIVILQGARTPFGSFGGSLKDVPAVELGVIVARGALERSRVHPEQVDHVVFGNVIQTSGEDICIGGGQGIAAVFEAFHG